MNRLAIAFALAFSVMTASAEAGSIMITTLTVKNKTPTSFDLEVTYQYVPAPSEMIAGVKMESEILALGAIKKVGVGPHTALHTGPRGTLLYLEIRMTWDNNGDGIPDGNQSILRPIPPQ